MAVETVALFAHSLSFSELQALPTLVSEAIGEAWVWTDGEPDWSVGGCRLWMDCECLWLRGPSGGINVGPRSASLSPHQRIHYGALTDLEIQACERLILATAAAFNSPLAVIVPDTGHPLSDAATWPHEGWSLEEMLLVLPRLGNVTTDFSSIGSYMENDRWDELPYVLMESDGVLPPRTAASSKSDGDGTRDSELARFRYHIVSHDIWGNRMLLSSQGAPERLVLLGVQEYRHRRGGEVGVSRFEFDSEWLREHHRRHPLANPNLRHYSFDGLEVLAIEHCLEM